MSVTYTPARRASTIVLALFASCSLALVSGASDPGTAHAEGAEAFTARAMQDLGTYQGDCFPWMRRILREVGVDMGFGYRQGYLNGGGVEVTLAEARAGDIIQLADDANLSPTASYPGLHTSIILENHGDGTFLVIDSNRNWDGIVTTHTYNPTTSAARFGNISVHVWRFPSLGSGDSGGMTPVAYTPPAPPEEQPHPLATPLGAGTHAVVASGSCLNFRATAGEGGHVIECLPDGTDVQVLPASQESGGYRWQQVSADGRVGWVADMYLQPTGAGGTTTTPKAAPTATATPAPATAAAAPATGVITAGDVPADGGVGLIVFGGGPTEALLTSVEDRGCDALSIWSTAGGRFIGYITGAPDFVNSDWSAQYPSGIPQGTPLSLSCA